MEDIVFSSTDEARTQCEVLSSGATYYQSLVTELQNAKNGITANWEGNAADITGIITRIDAVIANYNEDLIPCVTQLSTTVTDLANETDQISNNTVDSGATTPMGNSGSTDVNVQPNTNGVTGTGEGTTGAAQGTGQTTETKEKPGFWEWHGGNFAEAWTTQNWAEAWDYSGCDSGLDYVTTTVDALVDSAGNVVDAAVDTVGAAFNFVVDGACEIIGWLF